MQNIEGTQNSIAKKKKKKNPQIIQLKTGQRT